MGGLKIGRQFYFAHTHHSPKELAIATYKGRTVQGLAYEDKFLHPSFKSFSKQPLPNYIDALEAV